MPSLIDIRIPATPIPPLLVAECPEGRVLTKRFEADGTKRDFTAGYLFRYHELNASTWGDLRECLTLLTRIPAMCVLRGVLQADCPRADDAEFDPWSYRRKDDRPDEPANILAASFPWVVFDFDDTAAPFDLAAPERSIRAWHSTLAPELRAAQSAFFPSSQAHRSATVRGKLVVWYRAPVSESQARSLAGYYGADRSVATCNQPNYFAAPIFEAGAVDPLAAHRHSPIVFDGKAAVMPPRGLVKEFRERPAPVPLAVCPPGDKGILAALGPQADQVGRRFWICGQLGGLMRKLGYRPEACAAVLREWLAEEPAANIEHGVSWALIAWDKPRDVVSGELALRETVGKAHADVITEACIRARRPLKVVIK
ncbi:MAG TPA: hypothetical protein VIK01_04630 [Polyangiaceae bacterium]